MNKTLTTRQLLIASMFAALTLLATSIIKIQTPTFGYIHLGDTFVLLSGIFLGPVLGGLSAGIGSALSDLLGGYTLWIPGTFVIKALTAVTAALVFRGISGTLGKRSEKKAGYYAAFVPAGICAELVMTFGYFLYNILIVSLTTGSFTRAGLVSATAMSFAEIPFNLIQGGVGLMLATILYPVFLKIGQLSGSEAIRS